MAHDLTLFTKTRFMNRARGIGRVRVLHASIAICAFVFLALIVLGAF
jgi:hypothetical protein